MRALFRADIIRIGVLAPSCTGWSSPWIRGTPRRIPHLLQAVFPKKAAPTSSFVACFRFCTRVRRACCGVGGQATEQELHPAWRSV